MFDQKSCYCIFYLYSVGGSQSSVSELVNDYIIIVILSLWSPSNATTHFNKPFVYITLNSQKNCGFQSHSLSTPNRSCFGTFPQDKKSVINTKILALVQSTSTWWKKSRKHDPLGRLVTTVINHHRCFLQTAMSQ